jgi:hypothetical protein
MVVRFTYHHFWPRDQNSRPPQGPSLKEIFVLHPHWEGKLHGIDLKALSAIQLEIFKIVMDPRNNHLESGPGMNPQNYGMSADAQTDFIEKIRNRKNIGPVEQVQNLIYNTQLRWQAKETLAKSMKRVLDRSQHERELQRLQGELQKAKELEAAILADQEEKKKKQVPPMAQDILRKMKPARIVNNPRIFYNVFLKRFLHGVDAYRTFFPGRMEAVQEVPRHEWVGSSQWRKALVPQKTEAPEPKLFGMENEQASSNPFSSFEFGKGTGPQRPAAPSAPGASTAKPTPPGAVEKLTAGVQVRKPNTPFQGQIKTERPGTSNNIKPQRKK